LQSLLNTMPLLANSTLDLTCQPDGARLTLHDKRRGVDWQLDDATRLAWLGGSPGGRPLPPGQAEALSDRALRLTFVLDGRRAVYIWQLLDDGAEVTLEFEHAGGALQAIALPGSFAPRGARLALALPIMQGVLWDGRGTPFERQLGLGGHESFSMPMAGYLSERGGLLLSAEDSADWRAAAGKRDDGAIYAYGCALPSLGALGYPRRARLLLTDPGLTALCKRYRRRVQERGEWKPWADKIAERPSVARLFGALMAFVGYNASDTDVVAGSRRLRDFGFERVFLYPARFNQYATEFRMGGDPPIRLSDAEIAALRELGCDVSPWNWVFEALDDGTPERRRLYLRDAAGDAVPFWKIDQYQWYICCPSAQPAYMRAAYQADMRDMTWGHYDVSATFGLLECHALDHPGHAGRPLDRRAHRAFLRELLGPSTNGDRPVSSEGFNGPLAGAYDIGTTKLLPAFGDAPFWTVPMTSLVYHDMLIHDWWELHNYNAHAGWDHVSVFGRKVDGFARQKAAMDALYGCPPNVFPFGRQYAWVDIEKRVTRSYAVRFDDPPVQEALAAALPVARLHRRIGMLELVAHEFLSEDGAAQAATYADGTRVIANFADTPRDAGFLPPLSWRTE
jgi:hypothetical protein